MAAIKKDFGVDVLLVKLDDDGSTFDIELDGELLFSAKRDRRAVRYKEIHAALQRLYPPRAAQPWDLFDKNIGRVAEDIASARLEICNGCERYLKLTHQCKECGCIMNAKVKLPNAFCPLQKWDIAEAAPEPAK